MNPILVSNIDKIKELCIAHNVKSLFVFGSASNDTYTENSDIDFLVSFKQMDFGDYADNYFELAERLELLVNTKVDLVTDKSLSNPYFIASINKSKIQIYG